jgi:hypothetical protein
VGIGERECVEALLGIAELVPVAEIVDAGGLVGIADPIRVGGLEGMAGAAGSAAEVEMEIGAVSWGPFGCVPT